MPPAPPNSRVLVTGANGYIAAWIVRTFLEEGYTVRGVIRSESKGAHLEKIFESHGDKFEIAVVEDMTKPGAFDEIVNDVDLVVHTASPFHFKIKHPDDLIVPALRGTVGILESIKAYGPNVKRTIILASCASVLLQTETPATYDETSWNEPAIAHTMEKGADTNPFIAYRASKTLAEKAAWDFVQKNKAEIGWDLVVLNPPYVFGPPIHELRDVSELSQSMADLYDAITGKKAESVLVGPGNCWIDVRDLARAHVLAAQKAEAGGERIIISTQSFFWQEIMDHASAIDPSLPKGVAGATKGKPYVLKYDTKKMSRILGLQPRSLDDCLKDSIESLRRLPGAFEAN